MRSPRWLLAACLLLAGCERTELSATYHSPRRLDQEVLAVVPESQTELLSAAVRALFGGGWREHRREQNGQVRLSLTRRIDPRRYPRSVMATRQVVGPLGLRVEYGLTLHNRFAALAPNDPLRLAAANVPTTVVLRVQMPGHITKEGTNAGSVADDVATWTVSLAELAAQPERYGSFTARSRAWRLWLLLLILVVVGVVLWIVWPALVPPSEVRQRRA
ncbi:MAG: hypothetical protein HUU35_18695, partial [Armatimonadetes bacterium]|nr:hypothetical protein [Armatimonadota bacterium]